MKANITDREHTYGGKIYSFDFDTEYGLTKNIAGRILADWKFDEQMKKIALNKGDKNV